jgi:thiamine biosynthesis lipoprotein
MGLPVQFDICDEPFPDAALEVAINWLNWVDRHFSTYRPDSEISRLNRGELTRDELHPQVAEALDVCDTLRAQTGGWFDIRAAYMSHGKGPDAGRGLADSVDPSGYVKGWAVAGAMRRLKVAGARNACINAGGDVVACGRPDGDGAWRIGIQNPRAPQEIAIALAVTDAAVATSGAYARGEHIVDPFSERPPDGLLSVTIVGPDLTVADVYATTAFAMGAQRGARWVTGLDGYEAVLIRDDDTVLTTPGIDALRIR